MPPFFKKRRRANNGPNKNEKKVLRGRDSDQPANESDSVGGKFPAVQSISIQMDFITPQQQLFESETRVLETADECDFTATCPGRCGGHGTFDFAPKIASVVNARQTQAQASGTCRQTLFPGSPDTCDFNLRCKIDITYKPE